MTDKQLCFAREYLIDSDAEAAAIRAGYKERGRRQAIRRNLENAEVRAWIDAHRMDAGEGKSANGQAPPAIEAPNGNEGGERSRVADQQEILEYLTGVMRGDANPAGRSAAEERERMKAAELLGRRFGAFNEQGQAAEKAPRIVDDTG